ncbi:MAG TPA: aminotransferase class I/II-fold pyridoxal phosphate-dependent enzyme [Thermomicrobiales bacterium]|nr:aminotransferase class I/II-fold pyridoxal phosphate-dependent enzyme [Thermomicrobiales bacterium]
METSAISSGIAREIAELSTLLTFLTDSPWARRNERAEFYDFVFGNPHEPVLPGLTSALQQFTPPQRNDWHAYQFSDPHACEVVARSLSRDTGIAFDPAMVMMTNGAFSGLSIVLQTILELGDEVLYISPPWFFYASLIRRAGGTPVSTPMDPVTFDLDLPAIEAALTPRTRAIIVNSPHNPTGRIYSDAILQQLSEILTRASERHGRPIVLISDEAYRRILFDDRSCPTPAEFYPATAVVYTFGKSMLTPGERIGFVALAPGFPEATAMLTGLMMAQVLSGWAFPNSILQHAIDQLDEQLIDLDLLQRKRDRIVERLTEAGYEVTTPEGTFYVVVKSPDADDLAFSSRVAEDGLFVLPGTIFDMPGYFRISLTATMEMIEDALPIFAAARERVPTPA